MAVHIDRLVLIPTKSTVQRDKVQKKNSGLIEVNDIRFGSTHSLFFFADCCGEKRERGGYVIIVQANKLEMGSVYPLLKGVFCRIDCYRPSNRSSLGVGCLDLDRQLRGSNKFLPSSLKWAPDNTKSQNSSSPR